jgi:hypothetical protein
MSFGDGLMVQLSAAVVNCLALVGVGRSDASVRANAMVSVGFTMAGLINLGAICAAQSELENEQDTLQQPLNIGNANRKWCTLRTRSRHVREGRAAWPFRGGKSNGVGMRSVACDTFWHNDPAGINKGGYLPARKREARRGFDFVT